MDWSWLTLLACPLMMVVMMLGMIRGKGHGAPSDHTSSQPGVQAQLDELKQENERLKQEMRRLTL